MLESTVRYDSSSTWSLDMLFNSKLLKIRKFHMYLFRWPSSLPFGLCARLRGFGIYDLRDYETLQTDFTQIIMKSEITA